MKFRARLISFWEAIRASYWFVPTVMAIGAVVLSFGMDWLDQTVPAEWLSKAPWLYTGTPAGARTLLATIASSMIGLAGVVFSITIVALTLASGQFGSRLLRNFMRDRGNQITLGTFLSAFLYCLLVLRKVQGSSEDGGDVFIPQLSMLFAVLTAVAGLGVLIFFIHHSATSIQAPNVIASVSGELMGAIQTLYPERLGESAKQNEDAEIADDRLIPDHFQEHSVGIPAGHCGYVQRIESTVLMAEARHHDLIIRMEHRPGQFVQQDDMVLRAWPRDRVTDDIAEVLREMFTVSDQRSLAQDAEFALEQLVEVATRALSPGINDPFTAIQCVERVAAALSDLATRQIPRPYRVDQNGNLRVLAYPRSFADFLDTGFNQIRQYAADSLDVLLAMLEAMERIARHIRRAEDRQSFAEHLQMVYDTATAAATADRDRNKVERRHSEALQSLSRALRPVPEPSGRTVV